MAPRGDVLEHLVESGKVTADQVTRVRGLGKASGERAELLLARQGLVREPDLAEAMAAALGLRRIGPEAFPPRAIAAGGASVGFLRKARILPIEESAERLVVAAADPLDEQSLRALELFAGRRVEAHVALPSDIDRAFERLYAVEAPAPSPSGSIPSGPSPSGPSPSGLSNAGVDPSEAAAADGPAIRAVEDLIARAVSVRASDLHLEPVGEGLRVRYRIDGELMELGDAPAPYVAA